MAGGAQEEEVFHPAPAPRHAAPAAPGQQGFQLSKQKHQLACPQQGPQHQRQGPSALQQPGQVSSPFSLLLPSPPTARCGGGGDRNGGGGGGCSGGESGGSSEGSSREGSLCSRGCRGAPLRTPRGSSTTRYYSPEDFDAGLAAAAGDDHVQANRDGGVHRGEGRTLMRAWLRLQVRSVWAVAL